MKNIRFTALVLAGVLLSGHAAFALSTETRSTVNGSSSSNFSDPDEQAPPGLAMSDPDASSNASGMVAPSVNLPTLQQRMGVDQGGQDFDHAYNHLSNQNR